MTIEERIQFLTKMFNDGDMRNFLYNKDWTEDYKQLLQDLKEEYFNELRTHDKIKYLGWANIWKEEPEEYKEYRNNGDSDNDIMVCINFGHHAEIHANLTKKWWYVDIS